MSNEIKKNDEPCSSWAIVGETLDKLVKGLTENGGASRSDVVRSIGHVVQRSRIVGFYKEWVYESGEFREKGRNRSPHGVCTSTNEPSGTPCDDALYCTETDECNGSGTCVGSGSPCHPWRPYCCEIQSACYQLQCQ